MAHETTACLADCPTGTQTLGSTGISNGKSATYTVTPTMDLGNPFASFLSLRPRSSAQGHSQSQTGWRFPHPEGKTEKAVDVNDAMLRDAAVDPFSHFLSMRPPKPVVKPESHLEVPLREEVLRVKRQLLEVTVQSEVQALDRAKLEALEARLRLQETGEGTVEIPEATKIKAPRHVRKAQKYLQNPEQTADAWSDASEEEKQEAEKITEVVPDTRRSVRLSMASSKEMMQRGSKELTAGPRTSKSATDFAQTMPARSSLSKSSSTPAMSTSTGFRRSAPMIVTDEEPSAIGHASGTLLPPIAGATPMNSSIFSTPSKRTEENSLLKCWFTRTRTWNANISQVNMLARRKDASLPGGAVILGDGRMPLFAGKHLLSPGYFFSFQIESMDDANFPLSNVKDLSFAFGISRLPPWHRSCERPNYGYEVPGTVMIGYGSRVIDGGKWFASKWDPRELNSGDIVGVLVTPDGDLTVFVNSQQVLRIETSLADDMPKRLPTSPKSPTSPLRSPMRTPKTPTSPGASRRSIYPIVDLHGRVNAVRMCANGAPPNVVLGHRNKLSHPSLF